MNKKKLLGTPYFIWSALFILIPLGIVFYYGLTDEKGALTLKNIMAISSPGHAKSLWIALCLSFVSTLICLLLAYPLAMILSGSGHASPTGSMSNKPRTDRKNIIVLIFILPMWMNFLLRTLAWQTLLEKTGVINNILTFLHLPALKIINTPYAIILGMVYNFLPFMVLPVYNSLIKIDPNVIHAARDLGANEFQVFTKITLPLTTPGIISGITMVFIPALTTFLISKLLGGGKILLIGNVIEEEFTQASNWHLGSGLSIVLMMFIIFNMVVSAVFDKDGKGAAL
ncbi:MAG: ABC transporter permease [Lachnospiraceae bacterium]|nr:ABC transporter permease [Lachnospiraceae bacterium]